MPSYVLIPHRWLSVAREDAMAAFAKSSRRDCFNTRTLTITVRSGSMAAHSLPASVGMRRSDQGSPPLPAGFLLLIQCRERPET